MPFQPGKSGNPNGRPPKENSIRALLRRRPVTDKRKLIDVAYQMAKTGDVRWAEWIAKHSGEGANLIEDVREAGGSLEFTLHLSQSPEEEAENE